MKVDVGDGLTSFATIVLDHLHPRAAEGGHRGAAEVPDENQNGRTLLVGQIEEGPNMPRGDDEHRASGPATGMEKCCGRTALFDEDEVRIVFVSRTERARLLISHRGLYVPASCSTSGASAPSSGVASRK